MIESVENMSENALLNSILLVDDNEFTNIFNSRFLKKVNAAKHIHAVKNGQEALDFLLSENENKRAAPDLIFLDINMPIMDGWEFLEEFSKITKDLDFSSCKVVILTTSPNPEDEARAKSIIKVDDYRLKPISIEMIKEIMNDKFDKKLM